MKASTNVKRRVSIIQGQLRGIKDMIEEDAYCVDVITQISAARAALSSLEDVLLKDHLSSCVVDQMKTGKKKKAVEEMMKVYKLAKK